jgi:glycosyltransferase involved in cell wall biosynthesis
MLKRLDNLELVDYVPSIADFYQRCDAFILPSIDDGFGMALIEAMCNGCPCITTTNTGASELLTDGRDALIVEPAREDQLADAILRLYESEELRQALAISGRRTAASIVSSHAYTQGIAHLMNKLVWPTNSKSHGACHDARSRNLPGFYARDSSHECRRKSRRANRDSERIPSRLQ